MKLAFIILIVICFGIVGFMYKKSLERQWLFLKYIKKFHDFYSSNITLFKNNIVEIIDNYIIMHKNKNANFSKIFLKNNNLYQFDNKFLQIYTRNNDVCLIIENYLKSLGKNEYYFEKEKIYEFSSFINNKIDESYLNLKNKGDLYFKLMLAIGAVIGIILWW